jgi:glycosyltransferase involved in cell wall biosynthesis
MAKLIIQIPCLNEAETLPATLADLPKQIPGIDVIETLIIDDGSTDDTSAVARAHGVHHIVRFRRRRGLAAAFMAGLDACLKRGADFIVNTDADNQYSGRDIAMLVQPLLDGRADLVIGDRNIRDVKHMSWQKKILQRLGSWVVRQVSGTDVPDTTSGFRAYSREGAMRVTVVSEFSYTLESIIQAGKQRVAIAHVEIHTNPPTRKSRLFDGLFSFIKRSAAIIVRIYTMYEPLKVLSYMALPFFLVGAALGIRLAYFAFRFEAFQHLASAAVAMGLIIVGFQIVLLGLTADAISGTRKLLEELLYRVRRMELRDADESREPDESNPTKPR